MMFEQRPEEEKSVSHMDVWEGTIQEARKAIPKALRWKDARVVWERWTLEDEVGKKAVADRMREGPSMDVGPYDALRGYSENLGGHFGITMIEVVFWALVGKQNLC